MKTTTVIEARSQGVTPESPLWDPICGYCGRPVLEEDAVSGKGLAVYHRECTKPPSALAELERRLAAVEIAVNAQSLGTVEHVEGFQWAQHPAARRDAPDLAALKAAVGPAALEYTKSLKQAVTSQEYTESL